MAITYPLSLPSAPGFEEITLRRIKVAEMSRNPYEGSQQVQEYVGEWWEADVVLPAQSNAARVAAWEAFAGKLNGRVGTFLLGDPLRATPRGSAAGTAGTPLVDGVHAARVNEIDIKGMPLSATGYLLAGDYIQLGTGSAATLHQLLDDLSSDGAGKGTALVWPMLRGQVNNETAVTVASCKGVFRMAQNDQEFKRSRRMFTNYSFSCIEAF